MAMLPFLQHFVGLLSSTHYLSLFALPFLIVFLALVAIYRLYLSPLAVIPGPWYTAISDFWLVTHVIRLQQCKAIHNLFEEYGSVVRVGPTKVVFRDVTAIRSVYALHKFDKSSWYKSLLTNDNDHAMTTLPHAPHAIRRKAFATHYSPANLSLFQPEMHRSALEVVETLGAISGRNPIECLALFRQMMVDVVCASSFGEEAGALARWAMDGECVLATAINDFPARGVLRSVVPAWAWKLVCKIPNRRFRQLCDSDSIMADFVGAKVFEARSQIASHKVDDSEKVPLLSRLLCYRMAPSNDLMSEKDIISECMAHLIAGSDTTATTLSYMFWELSRRRDIAKKLQDELDEAMSDPQMVPEMAVLNKLPYLNAFIKEGLRMYGAAPSLLERVVPAAHNNGTKEAFDLMGYALPPGTIVAAQAWSLHRDTTAFGSPDTFLPERWLEENETQMAQYLMPFGIGSRVCGGQNLAQFMLKITIAAVARNFDVSAPAETTERSMEIKDAFVIFPAGMKCELVFNPRKL
ncbi:hypothetical protein JAAARDRAFT_214320 [Jaapia argillacea MUCL 33604]|uniref:Cytochrome P450 n=1 Tax=Jaapia argillacea MUCL 33604 TaxID=933084 RepID=A0A067QKF1_9AGAM|nr:hypothetical protein JAAARDRAFT_214320 [Jaapia argillacea MUCL 33604]